ncbi:MAG: SDR family oxidoreductase [bacterium]
MQFNGKVVWITGASSGIGEALAYELSSRGARLIISSNEPDELARVKKGCQGEVATLFVDLSDTESLEGKAKVALSIHGHIDILINNGGISQRSLLQDTDIETIKKIMEIDFLSHAAITRAVVSSMLERKSGHIVVTSSVAGKLAAPRRTGYCAAKHALHGFFDTLRAELYEHGIKVTIVCPTAVKTNISMRSLTGNGREYGKMSDHLAEGITPEKCAKEIVKAVEKDKEEIIVGWDRLRLAVYIKRFLPGLFSRIIRKAELN